jgi:hypothetical protein
MSAIRRLSNAAKLNVAGLALAAAGMLIQIAAGSMLYPSVAGPIVLLVVAIIVAFVPRRWTAWVGLIVPLVLGLGAVIAALMSGAFIAQLTNVAQPGILIGSLMHVIGLLGAVAGGVGAVLPTARTTP